MTPDPYISEMINNFSRGNLIGQILNLLFRDHQFESHKSHGHWRLTYSLTSGPVRLVEIRTYWPGHSR